MRNQEIHFLSYTTPTGADVVRVFTTWEDCVIAYDLALTQGNTNVWADSGKVE